MRVLVTGHDGYIGSVLVPFLQQRGWNVTGLDTHYFDGCDLMPSQAADAVLHKDVRQVTPSDLVGFDAIVHLAALSNDPLGNLNAQSTYDINAEASVALGRAAKAAGVQRFAFASSCSIYGAASPTDILDEKASFNPVTPYGESKVIAERGLSELADERFSPVFLRNATAYGASPKLRADVMVNSLTGYAFLTGEVLIMSDGSPWRPLVHVEDICRAMAAAIEAPRESVHDTAFNIGRSSENYRVRHVAEIVADQVAGSRVVYAEDGGPDKRCYRVDFGKAQAELPGFEPKWTVADGVADLLAAFRQNGLAMEDFEGSRFVRLKRLRELMDGGLLNEDLFWSGSRALRQAS